MMEPDSIAILPAATVRVRNRDVEHRYRQDSDFYYVTGYPEPEAVAVLAPGRDHGEFVVFCRERDEKSETWHGRRSGTEGVMETYGAEDAFPISDIDDILPGMLEKCVRVYYTMGSHLDFDKRVFGWVNHLRSASHTHAPQEFVSLEHLLHDMRLYKTRAEVSAMRKAGRVTVRAHEQAMRTCQPGMFEYQVEAELLHQFRLAGGLPSYQSIVGGGENAVPMPGIMKPLYDDCRVKPQAAYRLTLTAERYEKLLLAIKKAKTEKPTYHLFAYNCNHFMSTIASAVGILPPEDIYKPSLVYFYEMMDRNEGRKVPRRASDMSIAQSQLTLSP